MRQKQPHAKHAKAAKKVNRPGIKHVIPGVDPESILAGPVKAVKTASRREKLDPGTLNAEPGKLAFDQRHCEK